MILYTIFWNFTEQMTNWSIRKVIDNEDILVAACEILRVLLCALNHSAACLCLRKMYCSKFLQSGHLSSTQLDTCYGLSKQIKTQLEAYKGTQKDLLVAKKTSFIV